MGLMAVDMTTNDAIDEILATQEALVRGQTYGTLPRRQLTVVNETVEDDADALDVLTVADEGLDGMYTDASPVFVDEAP
jgi:hypothetical protein